MSSTDTQKLLDEYLGTRKQVVLADARDLLPLARPCSHCQTWFLAQLLRYGYCPECMSDPDIETQAKAVRLM